MVVDSQNESTESLDLVDAWTDITELPYVHLLWVSREPDLSLVDINLMIETARDAENMHTTHDNTGFFTYYLGEEQTDGLREFLRMAYYHGILQDIADVKFHAAEAIPPSS